MDFIVTGMPLHPLLVHAVIALVPLTALAVVLHVLWPGARQRLGGVTPLLGLATMIAVPVTVLAGQALLSQVGPIPAAERHGALGQTMPFWAGGLFLASLGVWAWYRYRDRLVLSQSARKGITIAVGVVSILLAIGSMVMVYLVGDSGARAVWGT
jgi:uncharacterized membrane protein